MTISGSHEASLAKVASDEADVAAIDCVSYAHLARALPERIAETRILHRTKLTPALPFVITSARSRSLRTPTVSSATRKRSDQRLTFCSA